MYYFWFLLPLAFILLALFALLKKITKSTAQEDLEEYSREAVFCLVAYFIAVGIHKAGFSDFFEEITAGMIAPWLGEWFIYPVVLVVLAYVQNIAEKKGWMPQPKRRRWAKDYEKRQSKPPGK